MSFNAVSWVFKQPIKLDVESKMILLIFANYADENGISYPRQSTVSEMAGISKATFWRKLDALKELKLIASIPRRKGQVTKSSAYLLADHEELTEDEFNEVYSGLHATYDQYLAASGSLRVRHPENSGSLRERLGQSQSETAAAVSERDAYPISLRSNLSVYPSKSLSSGVRASEGGGSDAGARARKDQPEPIKAANGMLNKSLYEKIEETLVWLRKKKKVGYLPFATWEQVFIDLDRIGIKIGEFQAYYEWLESQPWVTRAINEKLLINQAENYLNRDQIELKERQNGKRAGIETSATLLSRRKKS